MASQPRDLFIRQKTQTINALRGHLAEYGVIAPAGVANLGRLVAAIECNDSDLPVAVIDLARMLLTSTYPKIHQAGGADLQTGMPVLRSAPPAKVAVGVGQDGCRSTPTLPVARKSQCGRILLCPQRAYLATSVADFCIAVLTFTVLAGAAWSGAATGRSVWRAGRFRPGSRSRGFWFRITARMKGRRSSRAMPPGSGVWAEIPGRPAAEFGSGGDVQIGFGPASGQFRYGRPIPRSASCRPA